MAIPGRSKAELTRDLPGFRTLSRYEAVGQEHLTYGATVGQGVPPVPATRERTRSPMTFAGERGGWGKAPLRSYPDRRDALSYGMVTARRLPSVRLRFSNFALRSHFGFSPRGRAAAAGRPSDFRKQAVPFRPIFLCKWQYDCDLCPEQRRKGLNPIPSEMCKPF